MMMLTTSILKRTRHMLCLSAKRISYKIRESCCARVISISFIHIQASKPSWTHLDSSAASSIWQISAWKLHTSGLQSGFQYRSETSGYRPSSWESSSFYSIMLGSPYSTSSAPTMSMWKTGKILGTSKLKFCRWTPMSQKMLGHHRGFKRMPQRLKWKKQSAKSVYQHCSDSARSPPRLSSYLSACILVSPDSLLFAISKLTTCICHWVRSSCYTRHPCSWSTTTTTLCLISQSTL